MQEIGQRLTWREIVMKYPDRWVAISDYVMTGAELQEGVLQAVCEDTDIGTELPRLKKLGKKIYWKRTTNLEGANVLYQNLF